MKKLFYLSAVILAVSIQGSALASGLNGTAVRSGSAVDGDTLKEEFCNQYSNSSLSQEEVAERIKLYISELDNPTLDQLSALLDISEKMERGRGRSLSSACN